jgi:hypothetical protein
MYKSRSNTNSQFTTGDGTNSAKNALLQQESFKAALDKLVKKPKANLMNMDPVMFILSGTANVVFKDTTAAQPKEHVVCDLRAGDSIGLSQLLQIAGFEFFGSIRA